MPLTDEQRQALWDEMGLPVRGLYTLSARPGTGKTTTLTDYCVDLADEWLTHNPPWSGMAVVSYTNVAKDELVTKFRRLGRANVLLKTPHFLGTLDAFINQHLFLPFGARIMNYANGRPKLVGEPHHQWRPNWPLRNSRPAGAYDPLFFDCYSIGIDAPIRIDATPRRVSTTVMTVAQPVTTANHSKIISMKEHVWQRGIALQADANYIALQALRASPLLAGALARRFPTIVVDEAQDMTEIQHAIIDHLVAAGHTHVVLVGDENQAIYEWNTARPHLFVDKSTRSPWTGRKLTLSYRCSPPICRSLSRIGGPAAVLEPAPDGKNLRYALPVTVRTYDPGEEIAAVSEAIELMARDVSAIAPHDDNAAGLKTIAVIGRSADDARVLEAGYAGTPIVNSERPVWDSALTRDYVKLIHSVEQFGVHGAVKAYEAVLQHAIGAETIAETRAAITTHLKLTASDLVGYRVAILSDLAQIAAAIPADGNLKISDCVVTCDAYLSTLSPDTRQRIARDCESFRTVAKAGQDRTLSSLFNSHEQRSLWTPASASDVRVTFSTAHGVKGETYDGVIFYAKQRVFGCGCPESAGTWQKILDHSLLACETKRIAYVALSRAAQALTLVVPISAAATWTNFSQHDGRQQLSPAVLTTPGSVRQGTSSARVEGQ